MGCESTQATHQFQIPQRPILNQQPKGLPWHCWWARCSWLKLIRGDSFLHFGIYPNNSTHRIHGTGIFTYIWLIFMVNVGIIYYTWMLWGILYINPLKRPCFEMFGFVWFRFEIVKKNDFGNKTAISWALKRSVFCKEEIPLTFMLGFTDGFTHEKFDVVNFSCLEPIVNQGYRPGMIYNIEFLKTLYRYSGIGILWKEIRFFFSIPKHHFVYPCFIHGTFEICAWHRTFIPPSRI